MQKLLIGIVVLVVLGVAADFGAARLFESRVTEALQRKYDLSERPIVQVRDFPFLPHLVSGHFSTIDLAATDASTPSISVAALELHLRDVRVPRSVLLGGSGVVRVARTDGEVKLSQAELNRLLADRLQGGSLTLQAGKVQLRLTTQILGRSLTGTATGRLGVREGRITFTPETVLVDGVRNPILEEQLASRLNLEVPLPPLPAGFTMERIEVQPGVVVLSGRAGALQIAA
jgi:LmeA-like phospholipid-binding